MVEPAPSIAERRTAVDHYVGIDVSLKLSSVCVVDATGKIVKEVKVEPISQISSHLPRHPMQCEVGPEDRLPCSRHSSTTTRSSAAIARRTDLLGRWSDRRGQG